MITLIPRPQCRNTSFRKKSASFVLALIALFCANVTSAFAASSSYTIDDISTLASHRTNIQSRLNSAGSGNTVTVTGSRTGMGTGLELSIPSGVTLIWQASLSGSTASDNGLLRISGPGGFRMESGVLENAEARGFTLDSAVTGGVEITGSAQIRATGSAGVAIWQSSNGILTINGSAQVSSAYWAINSVDTVKVGGNSSVTGGFRAINTESGVEISGGTLTSTGTAATIVCVGNVTVSGGAVSATGSGSNAILIQNGNAAAVNISGGTVSSNGVTIETYGTAKVDVTVSGGMVSSANSYAICGFGSADVVTVSGGEVTSAGTYTIMMLNESNTAKNVVVSGTGNVRNTAAGGNAIRSYGGVEVAGNALVTATTGNAIYSRSVTINGGAVFAYGTAITGGDNVIRTTGGTYTPPTTNGIAIAWDNTADVANYAQNSKLHITAQPQTGSAYWDGSSGVGIKYANGSADGFIPISGVTIGAGNIQPAATDVGINGAAPLVGTPLTGSYTYNAGSGTGAGTESGSTFKWYRGTSSNWSTASAISGATGATYTPTGDDIGKYLFFEVTPSNGTVTGNTVHSAASAQAGVMVNLTVTANSTSGSAYIGTTSGVTSYKAVSTASFALRASLGNSVGVTWSVTSGGGSIANSTATSTSYTFPSTLSGITGPISITASFTPDTVEPVLSDVSVDMIYETTAALHFKSTKTGTYYYLVYAAAATPPDAATIVAQGTAVAKGSGAVIANQPMSVTMSGLTAGTGYKAYVVVDLSGVSNTSAVSSYAFSTVTAQTYGLRFHANTGKMHMIDGSGIASEPEYTDYTHWSWDNTTRTLTLDNFNWVTSGQNALVIMDGDIKLNIIGANSFMSTYSGNGASNGITFINNVTVMGGGTLEAIGGSPTGSNTSSGIDVSESLTLESGSLTAIGGAANRSYGISLSNNKSMAINGGSLTARATAGGGVCQAFSEPTTFTVTLPAKYIYWVNTSNPVNPGGAGTTVPGGTAAFALNANHKYVSIQEIPLSTEKGLTGVAGQDVSYLAQTGTSVSPVSGAVDVANSVATLALTDITHTGNTFNLYSNSGFTTEVTGSGTIALTAGGATTVYIKVTAENNSEAYYAITINRAPDTVISIAEILGVTPPAYGETPVTSITATDQYTGAVTWSPNDGTFNAATTYTATITLTPKEGYTLTGVTSNFFYVPGALDTRNAANNGVVTAYFSATAAPPTAPEYFTATAGDAQVVLNWTTPGDGGSAITKYQYSYGAAATYSESWNDIPSSGAATTTHTVTGLTNGTGYTFEVRAVNAIGAGTEASATATPATVPGVPQSFTATPGDTQVVLSWTAPASDGGSAITKYQYSYGATAGYSASWNDIPGSGASTTTYTVTGLTNGTGYTFEVRAVNGVGNGATSGTQTATPTDTTAPTLSAGSVNRTSDTEAAIGFTTNEAGTAYYLVVNSGATAPSNTDVKAANQSLGSVSGTVTGKSVTLTAGAKDIYVVVEDANGNISDPLKIEAAIFVPTYGISIGAFSNGSVVTDKTAAAEGETVTLTVYPDQGYILNVLKVFKDLNDLNSEVALSNNYAFTMPAQAVTVTATFKKTADQEAVEAAKALIENAGFAVAQAAANTEAYVKAWLADYINSLISGTGVSISFYDIWISSFSAATAGNAYNYYGTDGSFSFSVSLSSGGSSETAYASGTIAATTYTPPATYAVTIAATSGGTVSATPSVTTEGAMVTVTIAPANGYELETISAYRTGSPSTTVALAGSGNTRTFTMPAYGVTVSATFRKTQAQLDKEAVEAAKAAIEGGTYQVAQGTANDAASVRTWLVNTLNTLFGQSHDMQLRSATSIDGDVTVTAITPATAGTESNPSGVNGAFTFTVTLNRGASNATATVSSGVIIATPYSSITGIEDVPQPAKLYAVSTGSGLQVHGLVPGEVFSIYNISGQLQFKGKATAAEQLVPLRERGIYIVVSGNRRVKTVY